MELFNKHKKFLKSLIIFIKHKLRALSDTLRVGVTVGPTRWPFGNHHAYGAIIRAITV